MIKFSEYLEEQVKQIPGYSTDDTNQVISEPYTQERDALVASRTQAMLSEIKTDSEKDSIVTFSNYYYYDKDKKDVLYECA